jgi:hypothetical protein
LLGLAYPPGKFATEPELFLLAFDIYAENFLSAAREALDTQDTKGALQAFFEVAICNMTAGSPSPGCFTTKTATEITQNESRVQSKLRQPLSDLENIIRTALSASPMNKQLVLSSAQTADVIVTFTRGLAVMERVHRNPKRLNKTAAALIKALVVRESRIPHLRTCSPASGMIEAFSSCSPLESGRDSHRAFMSLYQTSTACLS